MYMVVSVELKGSQVFITNNQGRHAKIPTIMVYGDDVGSIQTIIIGLFWKFIEFWLIFPEMSYNASTKWRQ